MQRLSTQTSPTAKFALRFLGVSAPTAHPPIKGAFPLTITPRDTWGTMVPRLALHRRAHPQWAQMVEAAKGLHRPDYAVWPQLDMAGQPLGVAWFAIVEEAAVEVGEGFDDIDWAGAVPWAGAKLPDPPEVIELDPEFMADFGDAAAA